MSPATIPHARQTDSRCTTSHCPTSANIAARRCLNPTNSCLADSKSLQADATSLVLATRTYTCDGLIIFCLFKCVCHLPSTYRNPNDIKTTPGMIFYSLYYSRSSPPCHRCLACACSVLGRDGYRSFSTSSHSLARLLFGGTFDDDAVEEAVQMKTAV